MGDWIRMIAAWAALLASALPAAGKHEVIERLWQSQDDLPGNVVRSIAQSTDGFLWVATAEGIARFDGFEFRLIEPVGDLRRYRLSFFRVFATANGGVWAATYQGGLFRVNDHGLVRILANRRAPRPPLVTQVMSDGRGAVVFRRGDEFGRVHSDDSVVVVEPDADLLERFASDLDRQRSGGRVVDEGARPTLTDRRGRTWAVGEDGELRLTGIGEEVIEVEVAGRSSAIGVNELFEDRQGNIWVALQVSGLARLRPARVETVDVATEEGGRAFLSAMEDSGGDWWFASRRGPVIRWTSAGSETVRFAATRFHRTIAALYEDRERRLWAASRDGSVFRWERGRFVPQFVRSQVPSKVRSIVQTQDGTLWFGGSQGICTLKDGEIRQFGPDDGVRNIDVSFLAEFPGGRVIAGGTSGKVLLGGPSGFKTIARPDVLGHQWVSGILPVSGGEVWVSTLGSGLFHWNGSWWSSIGANEGLADLRLTSVIRDNKGSLWMGSLRGIIRAQRTELIRRLRDPAAAIHWQVLDHSDGMPSRECVGGYQPAAALGSDGMVWFPTGSGVVRVEPDDIRKSRYAPPVFLQSARINGVPHLDKSGPIVSEPGRARLEFRFVGLDLSAPEKTTYRARLAGLDNEWRELGHQRVAAFEAVPPGSYTFEVIAISGDGSRSVVPAQVPVVIRPHFWETPWFSAASVMSVIVIAAGAGAFVSRRRLKIRIQALKIRNAREAERSRIARDLHDDLGASLTEISILSALASEEAGEGPLRPSLAQLSTKAKQVVSNLDEIVWAVNPREDTLRSLVDYITAFAREFLDSADIKLRVEIPLDIPDLRLAAVRRHSVFLATREALNNAVKHSEATTVHLDISHSNGVLVIRVRDNGVGFEPDYEAGGNGLGNLRSRMRDAGGDCQVDTRRREGTTVTLTLPLIPARIPGS